MEAITFPSSKVGLPKEAMYGLPSQLENGARSYSVHVSPNGITSVGPITATANAFVANSAGYAGQQFSSQLLQFDCPAGAGSSVFLDPNATTIQFRLYVNTTTASSATAPSMNLIGSGASFIDSISVIHNNTPIEQINSYGQLFNMSLNSLISASGRNGLVSGFGADVNSNTGLDIAHASITSQYYTFCMPLMSIIGQNTSEKWIPIGSINSLSLQLTTSALLPMTTYCTAIATQPVQAFTLDSFQLNLKYVDIGYASGKAILDSLSGGKIYIKSSTYTNSNVSVPNGSSGAVSLFFQIRNSSVKSLFFYQAIGTSASAPSGYFDALNNGGMSKIQLVLGNGSRFPSRELNVNVRWAEALSYLSQAWGRGGDFQSFNGVINKEAYATTIPSVPAGSDNAVVTVASALRNSATGSDTAAAQLILAKYPSMCYIGIDLEKSTSVLFSGYNTRSSGITCELNLAVTTTSAGLALSWGLADLVLEVDPVAKTLVGYI